MTDPRRILLIERDPAVAAAATSGLTHSGVFDAEWLTSPDEGLARLALEGIDGVVLGLDRDSTRGLEIIDAVLAAARELPVLLLAAPDTEAIAQTGVQRGAQDYLLTDQIDAVSLTHAVTSMIARGIRQESRLVEHARASVTLEAIGDAVLSTDGAGSVTYLNAVAETMTGWTRTEARGKPVTDVFRLIDGATRQAARNPVDAAIRENTTVGLAPNTVLVRRDGAGIAIEDSTAPIHDRDGQVTGAVIVFRDVSESRKTAQQLAHLAYHDSLTNLPNRLVLLDRIGQSIALARRHGTRLAVLFFDVDRFKQVNDSLGHAAGDQLLRMVGERLTAGVRQSDTVSRLGGDEFVVVLTDLTPAQDAAGAARKIVDALARPYTIGAHVLRVTVSLGAATYPKDGDDAESLIEHADTAMYAARAIGRKLLEFAT